MRPERASVGTAGSRAIIAVIRSGPVPSPGGGHDGSSRATGGPSRVANGGLPDTPDRPSNDCGVTHERR